MNYISFFVPVSEIEQMNISGGSSKGKETYWKNVYDVLLNLFGMKKIHIYTKCKKMRKYV